MTVLDLAIVPILAVHISADVLSPAWTSLGFVGLAIFLFVGSFRLREDEIPRIALLTSAFFVASSIHIKVPPSSVHLLLNGLAGVILGRRVCIAIPVGLLLQAVLLGHGAISTLGVNSCVMVLPALVAKPLFGLLMRDESLGVGEGFLALSWLLYPWSVLATGPLVFGLRRIHQRMQMTRVFFCGFLLGAGTVFMTSVLHSLVLTLGGIEDWRPVAALSLVLHIPVALIEGIIVGTMVDVIIKVKPSLLLSDRVNASAITPAETPRPAALPTVPAPR
jgi:cobalt/nickel transport system permease protein